MAQCTVNTLGQLLYNACILKTAAILQDMDAKQKSITELTEKVKETGETVRQLQTGESGMGHSMPGCTVCTCV